MNVSLSQNRRVASISPISEWMLAISCFVWIGLFLLYRQMTGWHLGDVGSFDRFGWMTAIFLLSQLVILAFDVISVERSPYRNRYDSAPEGLLGIGLIALLFMPLAPWYFVARSKAANSSFGRAILLSAIYMTPSVVGMIVLAIYYWVRPG